MIMIKCSKHSEKKWNGLNPVIPKAEGHFEKGRVLLAQLFLRKLLQVS